MFVFVQYVYFARVYTLTTVNRAAKCVGLELVQ